MATKHQPIPARSAGLHPAQAGSTPARGTSTLKPAHARFVAEYLKDHNATQAYIRAGYKARGNSAEVSACRLLRDVQISAAIAQGTAKVIAKAEADTGITLVRTLNEIAGGAFAFTEAAPTHADKARYLDQLMKHLGGYKKDNEQSADAMGAALRSFFADLQAGSGRAAPVRLAPANPLVVNG